MQVGSHVCACVHARVLFCVHVCVRAFAIDCRLLGCTADWSCFPFCATLWERIHPCAHPHVSVGVCGLWEVEVEVELSVLDFSGMTAARKKSNVEGVWLAHGCSSSPGGSCACCCHSVLAFTQ